MLKNIITAAVCAALPTVTAAADGMPSPFDVVGGAAEGAANAAGDVISGVGDAAEDIVDGAGGAVNDIVGGLDGDNFGNSDNGLAGDEIYDDYEAPTTVSDNSDTSQDDVSSVPGTVSGAGTNPATGVSFGFVAGAAILGAMGVVLTANKKRS